MLSDDRQLIETPISDETVFRGALIDVSHMQVRLPNGRTALREIVHHKGAAAIVPVDDEEYVYLVRQHRVVNDMLTWEIPAGKLDFKGEDRLEAAKRELREETGLSAERMTHLTTLLTTPGFCTEKIAVYLAQGLSQGDTHPDEDEFLGLVRLPLEEAFEMVMRGEICDGKTICGLMMAREIVARQKA